MIAAFISLLLVFLVIRLIDWAIRTFWAWLGGGKEIDRLEDGGWLDEDVEGQVAKARAWRTAQSTRKMLTSRGGPKLTRDQRRKVDAAVDKAREDYLDTVPLGWWQVVMIFFVCSILGLVLEEVWMLVSAGLTQSRVGLVWGPFSPLYGFGALLLTFVSFQLRKRRAKDWQIFLAGVIVGGFLEQLTGWGMEHLFNAQSWSYAHLPDAITTYVAWRFLAMWGLLGLVWTRTIMPEMLYRIGVFHSRRQWVFIVLLAAYLAADIFMTISCFSRNTARNAGVPPANAFEEWIDEHYSNEFIAQRFQNLVVGGNDGAK